jgi:hypothetical protein
MFFSLLSKNVNIKGYKDITSPAVFYGRYSCSVTLREMHKLGMFENNVLRKILDGRGTKH